jgi:two-component system, OmpR family, response regulator
MIKPRILLVDDDVALTRVLQGALEETQRYEVRTENNSRKVLGVAEDFRPDVVILDLLMPDMDGGELAVCLRTHPTLRNVRIVFLTAIISKDQLGPHGTTIGQHQILAKPVHTSELVERIDRELTRAA